MHQCVRPCSGGRNSIAVFVARTYFMNLPTSFVLPPEDVDRLRDVAGELLRQSADYQAVINNFGKAVGE